MVNFNDPKVIKADTVALAHFILILDGIFLWDLFTTMDFDWSYLTTKKKIKWPLFLYLICRVCSLGVVICNFISFNVTRQIDCQLLVSWYLIIVFASFACASMLITLRVVAIWNYNFLVTAVTVGMCITNIAFLIHGVAVGRSKWSNESRTCVITSNNAGRYNITATAVTDISQLIIMLVGLLRASRERHGFLGHLYVQGLMWLAAATIAETPTAVLMLLDLNVPWDKMFQMFSLYAMIMCATRMYRDLIYFDMDVHYYSEGPNFNSTLHITSTPRKRMATGTRTGTSNDATPDRFDPDPAFDCNKDLEINLVELTPVKDGSESRKAPSLLAHDDAQK